MFFSHDNVMLTKTVPSDNFVSSLFIPEVKAVVLEMSLAQDRNNVVILSRK